VAEEIPRKKDTTECEITDRAGHPAIIFLDDGQPGPIEEEAVYFGGDGGLFGILSHARVAGDSKPSPALIFVSGGNNMRAGINRNYTEWARDAALRGTTTLRFDIRGLGDSPPLLLEDLNQLYLSKTRDDLRAAIDLIETRVEHRGIVL